MPRSAATLGAIDGNHSEVIDARVTPSVMKISASSRLPRSGCHILVAGRFTATASMLGQIVDRGGDTASVMRHVVAGQLHFDDSQRAQ